VGRDVNLFLASPPGASIIDLSDPLPASGDHWVAAVNFGPSPGATGSGVLARLTLSALEAGEVPLMWDEAELVDSQGNAIDVGGIHGGLVSVGEPCP
jgi:hypothetical protein